MIFADILAKIFHFHSL